jgi:hypothetical protein
MHACFVYTAAHSHWQVVCEAQRSNVLVKSVSLSSEFLTVTSSSFCHQLPVSLVCMQR